MKIRKNAILYTILLAFGAAQFFVKVEPGLPELMILFLLPYIDIRSIKNPASLALLTGNIIAFTLESLIFGTFIWSLTSIYLTISFIVVHSSILRLGTDAVDAILIGGCLGCLITLAILVLTNSPDLYRYTIRFTGFFKDPNVTAPTAMFFAIAALTLRGKLRALSIFPFIIFIIALSRASYLALAGAIIIIFFITSIQRLYLSILVTALAAVYIDSIINLINYIFTFIGRGQVINNYDFDRSSNWLTLLKTWSTELLPLGPTYSDVNGFSAHSTILRFLVEQGLISATLFIFCIFYVILKKQPKILLLALTALILNSLVIDATHWRVLFIALAISLAYTEFKKNEDRTHF